MKSDKIQVLFICVHNSARSQMAQELLNKYGGNKYHADSAGLEAGTLNPVVVKLILDEEGIDISGKETIDVMDLFRSGKIYRYVITVCSREAETRCPVFPGISERINWEFDDPSAIEGSEEEKYQATKIIFDQIKHKIMDFFISGAASVPEEK